MNYRQLKAIEKVNKNRVLSVAPGVPEAPGIYILTREEEGFKYAYIGQAKKLLTRLAQHLTGYQHIDLSIKKYGLWNEGNNTGWKIAWFYCPEAELDEKERDYIKQYANNGYQLRNKTIGGQNKGKSGMDDNKHPKGYYDGLKQGYKNAQKFVANLFEKHLIYDKKSPRPNKNQEKAIEKFKDFMAYDKE